MLRQKIALSLISAVSFFASHSASAEQVTSSETAIDASTTARFVEEALAQDAAANSSAAFWRCDAWYIYNTYYNWYYISPNLPYARAQALGACQRSFGYYCRFNCYLVY